MREREREREREGVSFITRLLDFKRMQLLEEREREKEIFQ